MAQGGGLEITPNRKNTEIRGVGCAGPCLHAGREGVATYRPVTLPSLNFQEAAQNNILVRTEARVPLRSGANLPARADDASGTASNAAAFRAVDASDAWLLSFIVFQWRKTQLFSPS